ncbi:phosphonate C-P lyase system protein PhnH [Rhodobacteraceae bacterium NNCM2]|nr:phosphonate C-P lyase system protein PhnH [Coraliihabitans acroporae]
MEAASLEGGFADAPVASATAFRAALNAMARPGQVARIGGATPPAPLSVAAGSLLLTLCDLETPVTLAGPYDTSQIRDWLTFHTGAPLVAAEAAIYSVGTWQDLTPLDRFAIGTPEYPDRSATLIVEMPALNAAGHGTEAWLTGPGIETEARFTLPEIVPFQRNRALFPLGLDFFFTSGDSIAALPRTTIVEAV